MGGCHFFGVEADAAVGRGGNRAHSFEGNASLLVKFAADDECVPFALNTEAFDGSIVGCEYTLIQDVGERIEAHGDLGVCHDEEKGFLVVKDDNVRRRLGGEKFTVQEEDADGGIRSVVILHVSHSHLHGASGRLRVLRIFVTQQRLAHADERTEKKGGKAVHDAAEWCMHAAYKM